MAQECGFFNAQLVGEEYDRVYLAEQFAAYFASFIGNGVFGSSMQQLEVVAQDASDMSVKVLSGQAWINGWWYRNTTTYTLPISVADGVMNRIDAIVLRWGNTERDMWLQVIEGTPSANPVKPDIRRDADYYDLQLAYITIPAGSLRITQAQITDTRLDNSVCGLVTGVVDQIDTTDLYNQFETYFEEWKANQQADYESWTAAKKAAYDAWVANTQRLYDDWVGDKQNEYTIWTANKMAEYVTWVANMQSEYSTWVAQQMQEYTDWITDQETTFDEWADEHRDEYDAWIAARQLEFQSWYNTHTTNWANDFETWFETIRGQLDGDIAGSLQNQINELNAVVTNLEGMLFAGLLYFPASTDSRDAIVTNDGAYLLFTQRICRCN